MPTHSEEMSQMYKIFVLQVLDLPPDSKVLASYDGCPTAMYSVGSNILCLQGHPEFDATLLKEILRDRMSESKSIYILTNRILSLQVHIMIAFWKFHKKELQKDCES